MSPVVFNDGPLSTEANRHAVDHGQKDGQGANGNQDDTKGAKIDAKDYGICLYGEVQKSTNSHGDISTWHRDPSD
jgi:hypothetical protein